MPAAGTAVAMATQRSGATARDRQQDLLVLPADPALTPLEKRLPGKANDIGHLQGRPVHAFLVCSPCVSSVSASSGLAVALRCRLREMQIDRGLLQVTVSEQHLDGPQVGSGLEQMGGEAMA